MFLKRIVASLRFCVCLSFIISFSLNSTHAQGTSNKGTDFWVAYTGHIDGTLSRLTLYITSEFNAVVTINAGGTALQQVNIAANQAQAVVIDPTVYTNVYVGSSEVVETNKGIHITSDKAIIVYSHISRSARSAATLVFPTKVLGNDYYTVNYTQVPSSVNNPDRYSEFTIVGVEDGTNIEIIPSQDSKTGARKAKILFSITLNKGDVYQFQSAGDLSGSRIHTTNGCQPIAVFSGSSFTAYCEIGNSTNAGSGDNLYQQLLPVSAWGKNFVSAPFYNALHGSTDIYRIIVANDNTTITVNGSTTDANGTALSNPYAKGSIITFNSKLVTGVVISADNPISVAQLQTTQGCNPLNQVQGTTPYEGDPEMTILNPIEQTLKDVTVYSALRNTTSLQTNITKHFINIIIKTADAPSLKIDGSTFPSNQFTVINSEYSYLVNDVTQSSNTNPTHRIIANGGFVAIAYGYGNVESYGYLAGSDLKNLNQYIEATSSTNNQIVAEGCVDQPYKFILRLPYITNSLVWDFGNGKTYTDPLPVYTTETSNNTTIYKYEYTGSYSAAGNYKFKVNAINPAPAGCDANEVIDLDFNVYNLPVSQFSSADEVCINTGLAFTDQSTGQGKNIASWLWDFNDGTTSTDQNPIHIFTATGTFIVKLITTGETGCTSTVFSKSIKVNALPVAKFSYSAITCETKDISFTDQSTSTDGTIASRIWNFGDSTSSSAQNPIHKFAKAGTYTVTLKVLTDKGCESTFSADVVVHPMPQIDFEMPDFCLNDATAVFTNKTTIADGSPLTYLWNFGDKNANAQQNTSSAANPSHVYTEVGFYKITLTVTSSNSCDSIITKQFTVNGSNPVADFAVQNSANLCSNQPVQFKDIATVDFGEITKIEWYYDYGNNPAVKETDDNPVLRSAGARIYSHLYPSFNTPISKPIIVRMFAYSGLKCMGFIEKTIVLHAVPDVDFEIPPACLTDGLANFNDISTIAGSPAAFTYLWDFGDPNANAQRPNTSTAKAPVHAYTVAGSYLVSLTVTAANGCSVTRIKSITISGSIPKPDFNILNSSTLCSDQPVVFEDKATLAFGEITRIEWYFDNTNKPNDPAYQIIDSSPNLRSASTKQYTFSYPVFHSPMTMPVQVRMKAFSGTICVDETIKSIVLKAVPEIVFDSIPAICEEKLPVLLTQAKEIHSFPGNGVYSGTGISSSGMFDPKSAGPGSHVITYTFSATNGCIETKTQTVIVYSTPAANAGKDTIILEGGQVKLTATASGSNLKYKWFPATGLDHDDILDPVASPTDDITYLLTVTSDAGCSIADAVFVKVLKFPEVPNTFTPNGDGINDLWNIKYLESYPGATVEIFNRYGAKIYSASDYSQPWDGKLQGTDIPLGTYYYIINPKNGRKIISGSVTVIR